MTANHYAILAALIFTFVALLQLVRALKRWPVTIGSTSIPVSASWAAFIAAAVLAWLGYSASAVL
jgi:hypothetical protein